MPKLIPVVFDADNSSGIDDALPLLRIPASTELDLIGFAVVDGDGDGDLCARITARMLGLAGRRDIPVFRGLSWSIGPRRLPTGIGYCMSLDGMGQNQQFAKTHFSALG